jgi:hypothetical protein
MKVELEMKVNLKVAIFMVLFFERGICRGDSNEIMIHPNGMGGMFKVIHL